MNSGWADSERQDVTLSDVGVWAAKRRDALSQAFPGERLVIPAGTYKVRSNDTDFVFRPHTDYVWLAGDQTSDAVLVLEPNGTSGHDSVLYFRPRSDRSEGEEFWRDRMYGELWAGRRPSLTETAKEFGIETRHVDRLADALKGDVPTRVRRGEDASIAHAAERREDGHRPGPGAGRDAVRAPAGQGPVRDRAAAQRGRDHAPRLLRRARRDGQGPRVRRTLDRGHVLAPGPGRRQRRRVHLDRRGRTARDHAALDRERRRRSSTAP